MMILMINQSTSTAFYMKNNFWTKISKNGHCDIRYNFELQLDVVVSFLISVVAFYQSLAFYVANENRQKTRETTVHLEK